jgi:quercetin dioxygenase-like cupin family protein
MKGIEKIQISRWADYIDGNLLCRSGLREIEMVNSDGTGTPLLKADNFGADIIRFPAGKGVTNHVHVGAHILFVIMGEGFVEYNGLDHPLEPGLCYMIPSMVNHAIKASTELVLIAVGNDHRDLGSNERMDLVN